MKFSLPSGTAGSLLTIMCAGLMFMLYAFVLSAGIVSLAGGIADLVQFSRAGAERGASPLLLIGIICLLSFFLSVGLAVGLIRKKAWAHYVLMGLTLLLGLVLVIPQPDIGTGTEGMREVFSYLVLLGIIQSALYRTCTGD